MTDPVEPVALITGAGARRVGYHVASALGRAGYALGIHYRTSRAEAEQNVLEFRDLGVRAECFQADLTLQADVRRLVDETFALFGRIDLLVHTAAVWGRKPLEQTTADDLHAELNTNLVASFLIAQSVGLAMVPQASGGSIILVGDWACERPYPDHAAYFASKGAIPTLVRTFAVELAIRNPRIRVNGVLPGPVMLPDNLPDEEKREAIQATLVKSEGSPTHIAHAVLALAGNSFVTGACLPVDGGRTIYAGERWERMPG